MYRQRSNASAGAAEGGASHGSSSRDRQPSFEETLKAKSVEFERERLNPPPLPAATTVHPANPPALPPVTLVHPAPAVASSSGSPPPAAVAAGSGSQAPPASQVIVIRRPAAIANAAAPIEQSTAIV